MQYALSCLALAASVLALPQGVTQNIPPSSPAPAGCQSSYSGSFQITVVNVTTSKVKRDTLECTLDNGVLKDAKDRTGYVAANYQFQFDGPPQTGAIYTSGFSVCGNGTLALGGSAIWYQCLSGDFYNLYDRHWAPQCSPVYIEVQGAGSSSGGAATQATDGQTGVTTQVSQIADGQVQATPVSQIGDGQIQGPIQQIGDGQIQQPKPTGAPVGQIGDGQIQATSAAKPPVSQIGDGQVQAPSGSPVQQISDGQVQATSAAAPVQQISDGQVQATSAAAPVQQISDGQVQATSAAAPVGQIGDGQVQATLSSQPVAAATAVTTGPVQQSVNAAATMGAAPAIVAGLAAAVAFL